MKTTLYCSPYQESHLLRRQELEECFKRNMEVGFDSICLVIEAKDLQYIQSFLKDYPTPTIIVQNHRPLFQDYITTANDFNDPERLHIVTNSDIYFLPETLQQLKSLPWEDKLFVALSRWDVTSGGSLKLLDRWDSQDTFVWKGNTIVDQPRCPLGTPGVDNSICHHFKAAGYKVINPSKTVKTCHLHLSKVINYRNEEGAVTSVCPEPYHLISPHTIENLP